MDKKMTPELAKRFIEQMNSKLEELNLEVILVKKGKESQQKNELADRDEKIKEHEKSLNEKEFSLKKREAEIEGREIAVSAQEKAFESVKNNLLKMSEEVAAKKAELFSNAEKLAAELHEKRIAETNEQIQKMRDSANESCEKLRAEAESSAEKTRNDAESNAQKIRAEANSAAEKIRIEAQNECKRIINDANAEAQKIISKAKSDTDELEKQIADLTKKNAELSGENTKLASQILALTEDKCFLDSEIKSQKQNFDDTTRVYAKTMSAFETLKVQLESNGKSVEDFTKQISEMDTREQALNAREDELNERDRKLSFNERRNNNKKDELDQRESNLESEVEKKYPEIIADKDQEIDGLKKETESLRNSLHANKSIVAKFDDLTAQFGGKNAAEILSDYQRVQQELSIALEKLNNTPSYALQKTASDLQEKENLLKERENALAQKERDSQNLRDSFAQSQAEKEELKLKNENLEKDKKIVEEQLARLRSTYENPAERDERIKEINKPLIMEHFPRLEKPKLSEMEWLNNIEEKIEKSGLHFPRRILNAFHTALKTSEMSPLTVLAGVSGTGKSELPRLYSRFGGINFLGVPVQPNWDCQESMLGYYNSIDNCFEPTDMLRLLAQSQPLEKKYQ